MVQYLYTNNKCCGSQTTALRAGTHWKPADSCKPLIYAYTRFIPPNRCFCDVITNNYSYSSVPLLCVSVYLSVANYCGWSYFILLHAPSPYFLKESRPNFTYRTTILRNEFILSIHSTIYTNELNIYCTVY